MDSLDQILDPFLRHTGDHHDTREVRVTRLAVQIFNASFETVDQWFYLLWRYLVQVSAYYDDRGLGGTGLYENGLA